MQPAKLLLPLDAMLKELAGFERARVMMFMLSSGNGQKRRADSSFPQGGKLALSPSATPKWPSEEQRVCLLFAQSA